MNANGFTRLFRSTPASDAASLPDTTTEPEPGAVARRTAPCPPVIPPDPEVTAPRPRRRHSVAFKRRILEEADRCPPGQLGALLRREGLYSSSLQDFRRQRDRGLLDPVPSRSHPSATDPRVTEAPHDRLRDLERENRRLTKQLQQAQLIIECQKKLSELLGLPLDEVENERMPPWSATS